jgi:hypothetical protein
MLHLVKINTMGRKKKEVKDQGRNVRIPTKEFLRIKKYAQDHNYKLGGFVTQAAIEKIENGK